jgi:spermidine/putrescine transport system ATP-binding protein
VRTMGSKGQERQAPAGDLRLASLTKRFGVLTAVDDLSLTVPQGSFFALLGASGCGKTTTLRMIAGLEEPTSGQVLLGDRDIAGLRPYKRPVNTVFQSYALFPHLDIHENVAFGLRRRGIRTVADQVERMLATAGASRPSSPAGSSSASRWPGH